MASKFNHVLIPLETLFCLFFSTTLAFSQSPLNSDYFTESQKRISELSNLITQVENAKNKTIGIEAKALTKQLQISSEVHRNLVWQLVDDLLEVKEQPPVQKYSQFAHNQLRALSRSIQQSIDKGLESIKQLEEKIVMGLENFTISGKAKMSSLETKLSKKQKEQEKLYFALVKNSQKMSLMQGHGEEDFTFLKPLVTRQANMLSGRIGLHQEKLIKLDKKLSTVSSDSKVGKQLLTEIRTHNLLIQNDSKRLQNMAELLETMKVDASIYKKRVIQSTGSLGKSILDKKVLAQLINEWWINTKKWGVKQFPELTGKVVTFLFILLIAICVAKLVKRMLRRLFRKTLPEMSELAKNFIVSMSSKLLILAGFLLALSNMGVQIGPILAGLGILGFVVGFALQDTLSNFASGLMILIYRPYDVGDKIKSAGVKGQVSKMNLVSTTIYTSENHQLTVPNKKIWGDIIHNITSQPLQRLDLFFTVPYGVDSELVRSAIAEVIDTSSVVVKGKGKSVRVHELGEVDVKYLARFWVETDDRDEAQWAISEGVKNRFDGKGISLTIMESSKS